MRNQLWKSAALLFLVLILTIPVFAAGEWNDGAYITDHAGLLTLDEYAELNACAEQISREYDCGVYIMTVWDFTEYGYGYDVFETTWQIYHNNQLGYGDGRDGLILLLSMAERDFALFFYGEAEYAFDAYGQEKLEEAFLDELGDNDWYGGFSKYLYTAEDFLHRASQGEPVRESPLPMMGVFVVIALGISAIVTGVFWAQMRNVAKKSGAGAYVSDGGLKLTHRTDLFLRQSRKVRHIPKQSSSSGSRSGGGGSGRSGKF